MKPAFILSRTAVLFVALFSSAAAQAKSWITYENTEYGFSLEYPKHWDRIEGPEETDVFFAAEREKKIPRQWRMGRYSVSPTFYVTIKEQEFDSLSAAGENYKVKLSESTSFKAAKIISERKMIYQDTDALQFIGEASVMGMLAKWKLIMFHHNGYYFEVCCTLNEARYKEFVETMDRLFNSFRLTGR